MATQVDSIKKELENLYGTASTAVSNLDRLHAISDYISYTKSESLVSDLLLSIREDKARESISQIKKSVYDPVYEEITHIEDMAGVVPETFPTYQYYELEKGHETFLRWKHVKDEDELSTKQIEITRDTKDGDNGYTTTESGKTLLTYAEFVYLKHLEEIHIALLKELDRVKEKGLFSKYLSYNPDAGVLYFQGKEIRINNRKVPSNPHYLLKYLFENDPFEQHSVEDMNSQNALFEQKTWKSYYDACIDIKSKVKDATGIDDFLDFSTGTSLRVSINSDYSLKA